MGRGLSEQQRRILAVGVALNAARNGGTPRPAELVATEAAGTSKSYSMAIFGKPPIEWETREAVSTSPDAPELSEPFLFVVFAGFRREAGFRRRWFGSYERRRPMTVRDKKCAREKGHDPDARGREVFVRPYEVYGGTKWDPATINHTRRVSLSRSFQGLEERGLVRWATIPRYFDEQIANAITERWSIHAREFWETRYVYRQNPAFLTPAAFDVVGDQWLGWTAEVVLDQWEEAHASVWEMRKRVTP